MNEQNECRETTAEKQNKTNRKRNALLKPIIKSEINAQIFPPASYTQLRACGRTVFSRFEMDAHKPTQIYFNEGTDSHEKITITNDILGILN